MTATGQFPGFQSPSVSPNPRRSGTIFWPMDPTGRSRRHWGRESIKIPGLSAGISKIELLRVLRQRRCDEEGIDAPDAASTRIVPPGERSHGDTLINAEPGRCVKPSVRFGLSGSRSPAVPVTAVLMDLGVSTPNENVRDRASPRAYTRGLVKSIVL